MAPAGPELAGSCCDTVGIGDCNPARRRRAPDGDPLYNCKSARDFALTGCTTVLCAAHGRAHAGRPYSFSDLYLHLRDAGRKEPPRRDGAHTTPGCPSVGADPRLPLIHGRVLHLAVSRQHARAGTGRSLRHLHKSSLEHGLQLLPSATDHSERSRRGKPQLLLLGLAAVDVGWLVLRRSLRSDFSWRHSDSASRCRLLCRAGSRISGRLVAPSRTKPTLGSNPSISERSWLSACSRSSCPASWP